MQEIIGGEFEIADLSCISNKISEKEIDGIQFYSSGRAALFSILHYLKTTKGVKRILLPDYLCSSIVYTVISCGIEYEFYQVDENLLPNLITVDSMIHTNDSILVINYFGLLNLECVYEHIRSFQSGLTIIEDDVQALPSFLNKKSDNVDFSFTSLRKWLPVPDGGLAKNKEKIQLPEPSGANSFAQYKLSGLFLKGNRFMGIMDDSIYLDLLEKGESLIEANLTAKACDYTINYFFTNYSHLNFNLRKRNSHYLLRGLKEIGISPIVNVPSDATPFFIPIWLENRNEIRKEMFKQKIFCPIHWPLEGMKLAKGSEMAEHELSLIIDQRYTFSDLDRIISILSK